MRCFDEKGVVYVNKMNKIRSKLKAHCVIAIIFVGVLLGTSLTFAGINLYTQRTLENYNDLGLKAARIVAGYFSDDDIVEYADLVNGYVKGTVTSAELNEVANSAKYQEISKKIYDLRERLGFNDLLVCSIDLNILENHERKSSDSSDWKSIRYIMDSNIDPEKRVYLGSLDTAYAATKEKLIAICHGNKNAYEPFVSNANYGHLITSIIPIKVDGSNVAFVFAEVLVEDYEKDVSSFILWTIFVSLVIVAVLVLIAVVVISRRFVKPILSISSEVGKFVSDNTKVSEELKNIKTGDEIELLARSVLKMEIDTEKYIENLVDITAEEERIKSELGVATHIQADMLPSIFPPFPNRNEFSLTASMSPAKEVGGDFYDFFFVDNNHLGLVMADVSGKGVPAALFMVIAKTLIKDKAILDGSEGNYSTAEVLKYVNTQLCDNNREGFFVTVWFAILDLATGEGIESNAGHEYPAICRNGGKYELIKSKHSPAVAIMEGTNFKENGFKLNPGDSLYVYTDGVTEATNSGGALFGEKRLIESLNRDTSASTTETLAIVRKDVDKFVGGASQFDDITMLCFKYYGKGDPRIERDNLEGSS